MAPRSYATAVQAAGAAALLLPPDAAAIEAPDTLLDRIDALLLAGGADVDPGCYGAEPHAETSGTWPERDRFEIALTRRALERGMPVLGICRGMQLLNVAAGGTLVQHLPDVVGNSDHRHTPGAFGDHEVRLAPGSCAARAAGAERLTVKSHHHQGVDRLGAGLFGQRLVDRRRGRGGDRARRPRVRARGALASGGRCPQLGHRGARRGCAHRSGQSMIEVVEPATEQVMAEVPRAGVEETDAAVARAKAAFPAWRRVKPGDRAALLHRLADALESSSSGSRLWRRATPASRSPTRAARWRWWCRRSGTTPARRSGCWARRSRSPEAST